MMHGVEPTRQQDYPEWYQQVLKVADLAEHSPVRGCMVIKPWGYGIWENMQKILDGKFKETGHQNAYFPLFIPLSFLEKEAAHVEGFAKECAVVTHHRLEKDKNGKLVPAGELEEPLIVRPTSETIIGEMFAKWIGSYRDLPLLINQWANVVRWEMRTRLFLRTTEFLWQEGHTAHATDKEALEETEKMLKIYEEFARTALALPVIAGEKTQSERFPGAEATYTIEAMTQDRKALQCGTSHFLGQNFAKASQIEFRTAEGNLEYAWTTSWGTTTRLIGAMVMAHGDDDGMVVPPKVATFQVAILPVIHKEESRTEVLDYAKQIAAALRKLGVRTTVDERQMRGGEKGWSWIKKGVPIRIEVGPRDLAGNVVTLMRRDHPHKETLVLSQAELLEKIESILEEIQESIYQKALAFRNAHIKKIDTKQEFYQFFTPKGDEIHGGFALCHWNGSAEVEELVKKELNVTIRCIPFEGELEEGTCVITGEKSSKRVIFAKSY